MPIQRKKKHATKVSLVVSTIFHGLILGALVFFAAREGYLGKQLKTIAVTMAPKEKPPEPEKPKEPEKPVEPPPETVRPAEQPPQVANTPPPATTRTAPPATTTAVLPVAMVVEWLAHGAIHRNPGLELHGFDDLRIFQGVRIDRQTHERRHQPLSRCRHSACWAQADVLGLLPQPPTLTAPPPVPGRRGAASSWLPGPRRSP